MGKKKDKTKERSDSIGSSTSSSSEDSNASDMSKKYGKPKSYDPSFNGPIKKRGCTDIPCCILFVVFIIGMGVIAYIAFVNGDPNTIIYPSDYKGNVCNRSQEVIGKPYAFYFDYLDCLDLSAVLTLSCPSPQVCLEECPTETYSIYTRYAFYLYFEPPIPPGQVDWDDFICLYDIDPEEEVNVKKRKIYDILLAQECAGWYVESTPIGGRCLPSFLALDPGEGETPNGRNVTDENVNAMEKLVNLILQSEQIANLVDDFTNTWPYLIIGMLIAMMVSFLFLILLQWLATFIVWGIILVLLGMFAWGIYYTYDEWQCFKIPRDECKPLDFSNPEFNFIDFDSYLRMTNVWLGFFIALCVLGGITLLLVIILFTRIRIATALLEEASQALGHMLCTLFWPIIPFILQIVFITFWAFTAVFLASTGVATYEVINAPEGSQDFKNGSACDLMDWNASESYPALCVFQEYALPDYTIYLQVYIVLGLFWVMNFIIALGEMTLAGAYASYYWAFSKPDDIPALPLMASFWRSIRYHLGSLAFGSLIIAIIQLIRVMLDYVEKKVKAKSNPITRFIFCCCKCFFWCLEKFMRFINRNAYIEIAVYGYNFCAAAKNAFFLLMRNILRVAVLNGITSFILFLFKLTIALGMSIGAFYFFSWSSSSDNQFFGLANINYIWAPVLVVGLASYVISAAFFSVYDMGVDTLFLCFLEDLERNDGSVEKPYYMPSSLMSILNKKNKKAEDDKKKRKKKQDKKKKKGKVEAENSV